MKKKKAPTVSVACRISPELKDRLEQEAVSFGKSLAEQVSMMLHIACYGDESLQSYRDQLEDFSNKCEALKQELQFEQNQAWKQEPYASMLTDTLKNDNILNKLFAEHGQKYIPTEIFVKEGFVQNALIRGETIDGNYYFLTGKYGWAFTSKNRDFIAIIKRY